MKLIGVDDQITVSVTEDELVLLSGCIRETFEGVEDWEFHTRLGFEPADARLLNVQIHDVLSRVLYPEAGGDETGHRSERDQVVPRADSD